MKLHDLGIIAALSLIAMALISSFAHEFKKDCAACAGIEQAAETQIDQMAHLPQGTAAAIISAVD